MLIAAEIQTQDHMCTRTLFTFYVCIYGMCSAYGTYVMYLC